MDKNEEQIAELEKEFWKAAESYRTFVLPEYTMAETKMKELLDKIKQTSYSRGYQDGFEEAAGESNSNTATRP